MLEVLQPAEVFLLAQSPRSRQSPLPPPPVVVDAGGWEGGCPAVATAEVVVDTEAGTGVSCSRLAHSGSERLSYAIKLCLYDIRLISDLLAGEAGGSGSVEAAGGCRGSTSLLRPPSCHLQPRLAGPGWWRPDCGPTSAPPPPPPPPRPAWRCGGWRGGRRSTASPPPAASPLPSPGPA